MPDESFLEKKLATLEALYTKFGRDGLKDQSLSDITLLLTQKELQFRDAGKGRDIPDSHKQANRRLEMEIKDLSGYVNAQVAQAGLFASRSQSYQKLLEEKAKAAPQQMNRQPSKGHER